MALLYRRFVLWCFRFQVSGFRFQVSGFRLDGRPLFVETLLGECAVSKANLLAERSLSLVW
ncbi:hypothetical protein FWP29_24715 [Vibrio parahaemolyticus]|nr:hypothetical protein [Vibrio parahaemolyticus]EGQ9507869.1 hypothetical protein [Vibrio parahaemolyticus]EGQ9814186.1 hypothetical protein [Vibrio parahaemolyticus]EGR0045879.1 hypothetical protein [Vibrio parahaemolyticus]EGR1505130.1 hypothetical protein [Vibrio parahaemolyticus]